MLKKVDLYTDGACSGNPGPGGWAAILIYKGTERELAGGEPETTNNRMELTAVVEGLRALKEPCSVTIYSDSKYVVDALQKGWAKSWRSKNWRRADGKPALNEDLWAQLLELLESGHSARYIWVKGHDGNELNERVDKLAVSNIPKK